MAEGAMQVNTANWDSEVIQGKRLVWSIFLAVWCGPCKMLLQQLKSSQKNMQERFKVCKLDTDEGALKLLVIKEMGISHLSCF